MMEDEEAAVVQSSDSPYRVKLPGFVNDEEVGLGDIVTRASYAVGMTPCGGCERRAAALNRWVVFTVRGK